MSVRILSATPAEELEARRLVAVDGETPSAVRFRRAELVQPAPHYVDIYSILNAKEIKFCKKEFYYNAELEIAELLDDLNITPEIAPRFDAGGGTWRAIIFKLRFGPKRCAVYFKISRVDIVDNIDYKRYIDPISFAPGYFKFEMFEGNVLLVANEATRFLTIRRGLCMGLHLDFSSMGLTLGYIDNTSEPATIIMCNRGESEIKRIHKICRGQSGYFESEVIFSRTGFALPHLPSCCVKQRITDAHGRIWLWDDNNECSVLAPDFELVRRFRLREGVEPQVCVDEGLVVKDAGGAEFLIDIPIGDCTDD